MGLNLARANFFSRAHGSSKEDFLEFSAVRGAT
jgi:hypothetical protein